MYFYIVLFNVEFGKAFQKQRYWRIYSETKKRSSPEIIAEREPLADVNIIDTEIKIVFKMPDIKKKM